MINMKHQGTLARLLAKENLKIVQGKYKTAFFVPATRTLGLPVWKDRGKDVYDLLVGHEVGHALYTPESWSHDVKVHNIPASFMNVLEDIRIERLIQETYPGLSYSFKKGYKTLMDEDFFGPIGDYDGYQFMDRLNIKSKLRDLASVPFSEEEQYYFNLAHSTETWDDVISAAKEIYDWLKTQEEEEQKKEETSMSDQSEDGDVSSDDESGSDGQEEENHSPGDSGGDDNDSKSDEQDDAKKDKFKVSTDEAFRENEEKLNEMSDDVKEFFFNKIERNDLDDYVMGWKEVIEKREEHALNGRVDPKEIDYLHGKTDKYSHWLLNPDDNNDSFSSFLQEAEKMSSAMAKEFELKKKATNFKRASVSETGSIDVNNLHSYKYNDDIFLKVVNIPDEKNHGLIMFVDYSASISNDLHNVIRQVIILAMYCRKANIRFDIYGFTASHDQIVLDYDQRSKPYKMANLLFNILSSEMPNRVFNHSVRYLFRASFICSKQSYNVYNRITPSVENLGATPTAIALLCLYYLIPEFKAKYGIENMNFMMLTDGEPNLFGSIETDIACVYGVKKTIIETPYSNLFVDNLENSRSSHFDSKVCESIIKDLRKRFGITAVGMFVLSHQRNAKIKMYDISNQLKTKPKHLAYANKSFSNLSRNLISDFTGEIDGYERYFMVKVPNDSKLEDNELVIKDASKKSSIRSAFSKYAKNKKVNKLFATMVNDMIAL